MLDTAQTLTVERLGHKGDGVAAGPIFIARTLPGEVVTGVVDGDRVADPRIVTPAPDRVAAPCPLYKRCGGCQVQHASDAFVADWKTDQIVTALAAHGIAAPMRPIVTSLPRSRRRAVLAGRRTKKGAIVGFHAPRSDTIVPLTDCVVLVPELLACIPDLEELTRLGASRSSTLSLAVTLTETGVDCLVEGGNRLMRACARPCPYSNTALSGWCGRMSRSIRTRPPG